MERAETNSKHCSRPTTTTIDASYTAESTETEPPWKTPDHGLQQCRVKEADLKTGRQGRCSIWTRRPPPRMHRSDFVNSVPSLHSNLEKWCSHRDPSDRRRCGRIPDHSKWPGIYRRRCGAQHHLSMTYMLGGTELTSSRTTRSKKKKGQISC